MVKMPVKQRTESSKQNPFVFVVGCPRSGTTLLQRMLDNHPQLAVSNEGRFIALAIQDVPIGTDPALAPDLIETVTNYPRFQKLGLPDDAIREAGAKARTYSEFVSALYTEYGRLHGKPLAGDKTPRYVLHLPRLHSLFPNARTIHLIRDGRDVALSILQWANEGRGPGRLRLWQDEPVAVCALYWRRMVSTGRRDGENLRPDQYREVRHEDLVAQPDESLLDLTTFLELPFAPEMSAFYEGKTISKEGISSKAAWLAPTPGLRDWRTDMSKRDQEESERSGRRNGLHRAPEHDNTKDIAKESTRQITTNSKRNPYVFVVGYPRSGTTLLQRMLNAHPDLAVAYDSLFIP